MKKKTWFGTKTWSREGVAGLCFNKSDDFRLVRKNNKGDYFIIPAGIKYDSTWNDWLNGVPEFGMYDAGAREKRFAAGVIYVGLGILALLMAFLSFLNFRDLLIIERGVSVKGKISTVQNSKITASGWVDYSLPNGTGCHDWMELAPNGSVRPGDDIIVAVNRACGHSVSTKNPLHPWLYLSMAFGIVIAMLYQLRKLKKGSTREEGIA